MSDCIETHFDEMYNKKNGNDIINLRLYFLKSSKIKQTEQKKSKLHENSYRYKNTSIIRLLRL